MLNKDTDAVIQSRNGSIRLPNKASLLLDGKPLIAHTIERVKAAIKQVIVATTKNKEDDEIEDLCKKLGIMCYRGSQDNVLKRIQLAAKLFKPKFVIRICGDQPLMDPKLLKEGIATHIKGIRTFSTTKGNVPTGMDFEIINYNILCEIVNDVISKEDKEHVTTYIRLRPDRFPSQVLKFDSELKRPEIKLTVDTADDYKFIKSIYFASNGSYSAKDIIKAFDKKHIKGEK